MSNKNQSCVNRKRGNLQKKINGINKLSLYQSPDLLSQSLQHPNMLYKHNERGFAYLQSVCFSYINCKLPFFSVLHSNSKKSINFLSLVHYRTILSDDNSQVVVTPYSNLNFRILQK